MSETESPVRYQVAHEIKNALRVSTEPMSAHQLFAHCPTAQDVDRVVKTIYSLKKRGAIVEAPAVDSPHGPRKTYRLPTEEERLMAHLESELEPRKITEEDGVPTIRYPLSSVLEEAPSIFANDLDCAADSCNGDEHCQCRHMVSDPIITAIERIAEPHWLNGAQDAARLRALAQSPVIARQIDVAAWLHGLADILEERSA